MVVGIETDPTFVSGPPTSLVMGDPLGWGPLLANYAVSADGEAPINEGEGVPETKDWWPIQAQTILSVVLNWFEELKETPSSHSIYAKFFRHCGSHGRNQGARPAELPHNHLI